jgi:heterodisulfide reductase subunit A
MVVLAPSIVPGVGTQELVEKLGISTDDVGFPQVTNDDGIGSARKGIFVVGCAEGPKNIETSVAQANAAVAGILREGFLDE